MLMIATDIDSVFLKYGGKPHLGKTTLNKNSLKNYDFTYLIENMKIMDPHRLFLNPFTESVFYD